MLHNMNDPRVRKTRRNLQDALVRLILKQGYDNISVQDIATEADAARITFYRHYKDKEELLTDCLNTLYENLTAKIERLSAKGVLDGISPLKALYDHIEEQEQLYRILFSSRGTQTVIDRLRYHLARHSMETLLLSGKMPQGNIPVEVIIYHTASAQLGLAMWWLDHNKPYSSAYMARISLWLSLVGILEAVGVPDFKPPPPPFEE